ncbi:MAG: ribonuclease P protein component [Candidatus Jacksonbacteria bacterium RIFOXYC2_FULL_44_29]|nr:MAG: ribonuclease P [Parcubacteria group bacterium GW2011_GWC2_44_22]OGY76193.1 MAG: ribonuclease P protein component [Candidatus Jacksonbacteria bacterium RIFOXYA2_FULL_43_12]OGY77911.1 MAG: ribonuclease P protein component [Candidatus Jacksonbacteria bacterium RIFOXYB2_FULL_44_15]OGY78707.1 MAG: ribonuclease P protein component [Candidatus Jacksonbacteria bacterium RIFOXYD2_FULL_43_21]OGY80280.1 MAG: ribonuclease P protein component [Candidatus Jacksonbacteria bacterium RIFOXYC2_FULL_44_29
MLPKIHRLTKEEDFKRVINKGRSFFIKEFGIKILPTGSAQPTRIGIIVPKKITRTIVRRNRVKRQVRNIFLGLIDNLASGFDLIFFARADFLKLEFVEMNQKISDVLKKMRLLKLL